MLTMHIYFTLDLYVFFVCVVSCRSELLLIIDRKSAAHVLAESVAKQEPLVCQRHLRERQSQQVRTRKIENDKDRFM